MLLIVKEKISKFYGTLMYVCGTCSTLTLQMSYIICKVTNEENFSVSLALPVPMFYCLFTTCVRKLLQVICS